MYSRHKSIKVKETTWIFSTNSAEIFQSDHQVSIYATHFCAKHTAVQTSILKSFFIAYEIMNLYENGVQCAKCAKIIVVEEDEFLGSNWLTLADWSDIFAPSLDKHTSLASRIMQHHCFILILFTYCILVNTFIQGSTMTSTRICLRNCRECQSMYGNKFEGHLCAHTCIKLRGGIIPHCRDLVSIAPYLDPTKLADNHL